MVTTSLYQIYKLLVVLKIVLPEKIVNEGIQYPGLCSSRLKKLIAD